jgi:hypothetical protein
MRSSTPLLLLLSMSSTSTGTGADLVRVAGFFAFGVELVLEPVRLAVGNARVPCLRETELLDLVLLVVLDFKDDIIVVA